ncbi:splicing factor U2AF-associated protein [Choiromyces venosus 120613-1]|uniref:Splicing factor U2AF-associated protein n=1 Tax=Choiromyces venosus 120613-1 TaxID=1336337 RepID=A0A3N4JFY7_9PEZI|nr:splicing factor U2AF-associated protein [Choiromyces venosus 120613-1]
MEPPPLPTEVGVGGGVGGGSSFPTTREEFEADPRVSWSRVTGKWSLEADDGTEFEYDEGIKRWVPVLDETLAEQQRAAYAVVGVDESEPAAPVNKKRKKVYTSNEGNEDPTHPKKSKINKNTKDPTSADPTPARKNTAVYITNLPPDTTEEEVKEVFSKCGVIAEEIDRGKPRIKLYRNEDGSVKGDALVVYFRPESVDLAVQMLDDSDFRFGADSEGGRGGMGGVGGGGRIKVQPADFSYKAQQDAPVRKNARDKKKVIAKTQKLNNKLADWDDDDPSKIADTTSKYDKVVILRHMFTLKQLEEDPTAILDLKEDIREECEKLGDVTNVVLYDKEEDGIVSVRFANAESARACVGVMHGRFFDGQKVEAYIFDGLEKFRKTSTKKTAEEEEAEQERLEKFGNWLEESGE